MDNPSSEHLIVDIKDIECMICYSRYTNPTNEAMILSCGHTVCSSCLKNINGCPFCKAEILQKPTKNMLLSSLLERDSQVNKCILHKRPIELYCKEEKKLFCSQCLVDKFQYQFEPMRKIETKMKEIKAAEKKINDKKEENKKEIFEKVKSGNENLKRKIDEIYEEKLAYDLSSKKKLKRLIDIFMVTEKDVYEHQLLSQGLSKYEENVKNLQENWKENPGGDTVEQILEASLTTKQAIKFYNDKAKHITTNILSQENALKRILQEPKKSLLENADSFLDKISEKLKNLGPNINFEKGNLPEIARNYLLSTLEDHGILVKYQEKEDHIELQESSRTILNKFSSQLFDCSLEKLNLSCYSFSDSKFQMLCEILENIQALSELALSIEEASAKKIESISDLILKSKMLEKFSCKMPLSENHLKNQTKYIENLLIKSGRVSEFNLSCSSSEILVDFQQDLLRSPAKISETLEEFTVKFIGNSHLFSHFLEILEPHLADLASLRTLKLSFGCPTDRYEDFLDIVCRAINKNKNLQELDLGFAKLDFSQDNSYILSEISQIILSSAQLAQVSLFLVGNELSDHDLFEEFLYPEEPKVMLEEFSLTIMRCRNIALERIIDYLLSFPRLKKFTLRINRVHLDFMSIIGFLEKIVNVKSLVSFDLAVRDFDELTIEEKKDLEVCKYRLTQNDIQHKIVFEELMAHHLPDYVDFVSEDEDDGDGDIEEEEEGDEGSENEDEDEED